MQAKTGSGKTAAFGLGLLQQIDASLFQTQALVLCPTRELADQVAGELRRLARFLPNTKILTLCGGQPFGMQRDSLQHAPHIIVATPGRLLDHLQKGTVSLDALNTLVMDEADRMLDMGFSDAIDDVIRFAPASRQTLLFSATWPEAIAAISGRVQRDPLAIEIDSTDALPPIEQQFYETSSKGKIPLLQRLLSLHQPSSCVVFCNTKKDCQAVCDALNEVGQSALSLHGDLEQRDRDQTLVRFANGSARVLVATVSMLYEQQPDAPRHRHAPDARRFCQYLRHQARYLLSVHLIHHPGAFWLFSRHRYTTLPFLLPAAKWNY